MIYENQPPEALPVRGRSRPPGGRHRRPGASELPEDAPPLVLAVPGETSDVTAEIASLVRVAGSDGDLEVRVAAIGSPDLRAALEHGERRPVVVPLVTGPNPAAYTAIHEAIAAAGAKAAVTDPLGPHPLLAEALHVRLAEAGLARADRIRQFSINTPVDGVAVATVGGDEALRAADVVAVLLAARLAVPVVAARGDDTSDLPDAIARLRENGAGRVAVAPYVIGPEASWSHIAGLAEESGAGCAQPLGAHSAISQLVSLRYEIALDEVQE